MPVVGRPPSPPPAGHQQQPAQHSGPPPTPYSPAPAAPPQSYPVVNPTPHPLVSPQPPAGSASQQPLVYPPRPVRDSFVVRLMQRGVRGELLRQPWFHDLRHRNPDPFVYISFAVGVVFSLMLFVIPSSFVVTVLSTSLWAGIGYLYFALGTRLAHQFLLFGICLVGGLVMAARALSSMVALSVSSGRYYGFRYESVAELMFVLLINLVGVAAVVYIGIQVHRGIQKMSQP
ncbi:hypothetical protein H7J08_08635 [Mycobacterium frederiksbergense]|uniref:hypothetical protein n=1 Tax=Mycolicibacterium frederiksbergense TaxID=117567 RepID=UPI0021F2B2FF|nr:hypothetical protein [Mycolicibacterium frederiksbergense]MCV7044741.1 hypothetical protein [Mycolicibacterium frederiksbergense]